MRFQHSIGKALRIDGKAADRGGRGVGAMGRVRYQDTPARRRPALAVVERGADRISAKDGVGVAGVRAGGGDRAEYAPPLCTADVHDERLALVVVHTESADAAGALTAACADL